MNYILMSLLNNFVSLMCTQPTLSSPSPPPIPSFPHRFRIWLNADKWASSFPFLTLRRLIGSAPQYLLSFFSYQIGYKGKRRRKKMHLEWSYSKTSIVNLAWEYEELVILFCWLKAVIVIFSDPEKNCLFLFPYFYTSCNHVQQTVEEPFWNVKTKNTSAVIAFREQHLSC